MRESPPRNALILFMVFMLGIIFLLFFNFNKSPSLLTDNILNFGHVPLFMVVAAMALWTLDWENWPMTTTINYIRAWFIVIAIAILTEGLQQFTSERSFELVDIFNDLIGASVFLVISYQYRRELKKRIRVLLCSAAFFSLLISCLPVIEAAIDEMRARKDFPLLASFETRWEMKRWKPGEGLFMRVPMHAKSGSHSLKVILSPGLYPGVTMDHPPRDWRGYNTLTFNAFLEGLDPLPITVRINDLRHNKEYEDRYNRTYTLQPGPNHLTIDLFVVEHAPKGRLMDMKNISNLCIFSYKLQNHRTVYFDNFRLEKND